MRAIERMSLEEKILPSEIRGIVDGDGIRYLTCDCTHDGKSTKGKHYTKGNCYILVCSLLLWGFGNKRDVVD